MFYVWGVAADTGTEFLDCIKKTGLEAEIARVKLAAEPNVRKAYIENSREWDEPNPPMREILPPGTPNIPK